MVFASTSRLLASFAKPAFGVLRAPSTASPSKLTSSHQLFSAVRYFSSSNIAQASPRTKHLAQHGSGGKLKSHSGTKKRWSPLGSGSGKAYQLVFKRGLAGKRHLNSGMARDRLNNLGGTALSPRGRINRTLRRLLGPSL
ncbi:related to 50S ribosomal protein L35 [Sporisorium reilianum SRZ2]|uniref:Related to 50S ribosomal protein L35 n=2 Tax=Sporisorium reilianum TaxID=72558 RepID=E6ZKJ5_SPORE|nr:related to 50S ribosomal protein L35 [Sporisorium reilianum SRZ2]SJX60485.1 related to 50S ribosomal protein L35 [Sporisorium reilianum f. sp. reilianum]